MVTASISPRWPHTSTRTALSCVRCILRRPLEVLRCHRPDPPRYFFNVNGMRCEQGEDALEGFFIKFLTQTMNTGDDGHPR